MNSAQRLFDFQPSKIFRDFSVFDENHIPEQILHREQEIRFLARNLSRLFIKGVPDNVFITGAIGVGKSLVVKYLLAEFNRAALESKLNLKGIYISCSGFDTAVRICSKILAELGFDPKLGPSLSEHLQALSSALAKLDGLVVVLDDLDKFLKKPNSEWDRFFFHISRQVTNLRLIMLTNKADLLEYIDQNISADTASSFKFLRCIFPRYDLHQLEDILRARVEKGFWPGVVPDEVIQEVVAHAYARESARSAIGIMRAAGLVAEEQGLSKLSLECVEQAVIRHERSSSRELIFSLPWPSRYILYKLALNAGRMSYKLLYQDFLEAMTRAGFGSTKSSFYLHLRQLKFMDLVQVTRRGRGRGMGAEDYVEINPDFLDDARWCVNNDSELKPRGWAKEV